MSNVSSRRCARLEIIAPPEDVIAAKRYPRVPLSCRYVRATIRDVISARTTLAAGIPRERVNRGAGGRAEEERVACEFP